MVIIDEDLGRSGSGLQDRPGFGRLLAAVCDGAVGAVLALEASRLARNNRDWHHLVDLCALTDSLIIDTDGIYDPKQINDRLPVKPSKRTPGTQKSQRKSQNARFGSAPRAQPSRDSEDKRKDYMQNVIDYWRNSPNCIQILLLTASIYGGTKNLAALGYISDDGPDPSITETGSKLLEAGVINVNWRLPLLVDSARRPQRETLPPNFSRTLEQGETSLLFPVVWNSAPTRICPLQTRPPLPSQRNSTRLTSEPQA